MIFLLLCIYIDNKNDRIIIILKMKGEEKLQALRKEMQSRKYDAYIIPHGDQHDVLFIIYILL